MSEILDKQLFWEKYRPHTIDDLIVPKRIKNIAIMEYKVIIYFTVIRDVVNRH